MGVSTKRQSSIFSIMCSTIKISVILMMMMVLHVEMARKAQDIQLRGAAKPACNCQCSSLVWQDKYGKVQGNCRTADHTGAKWCYVREGSTCSDLVPSKRHPRNPWSYQACATPTQTQCGSGGGSFSQSGGSGNSRHQNNGGFGSSSGSQSSNQQHGQFSQAFGSSGGYGGGASSGSLNRPQ